MKIPYGFAIVLVACAGVAAAQPDHSGRVRLTDPDKPSVPPGPGGWVEIATPTPVTHGTEFFVVGREQGRFDKLRIDADSGIVIVRRVKIYLDGGKVKVVDVDKKLGPKQSAQIPLPTPDAIDHIVVTTEPYGKGAYAVYGSSVVGVATR